MVDLFRGSSWSLPFLITIVASSIVTLSFLGYTFGAFESNTIGDSSIAPESRTIPTYLALFIFAELKVSITRILFNLAMAIYASLQIEQIKNAISVLTNENLYQLNNWAYGLTKVMRSFLIAIPIVSGTAFIISSIFGYKLYLEFGWSIYKHVGADLRLKRRYLAYLFIVIVLNVKDVEFALTIAVIPVTILFLYVTWICVKRENTIGMCIMIVIFHAGMAYFLFKLVRMYQPSEEEKYMAARKTLTTFAVITLLFLIISIINAIVCTRNFGYGLREVINQNNNSEEDSEKLFPMNTLHLHHQQAYTRMTIE